jgi:hypothetical protein
MTEPTMYEIARRLDDVTRRLDSLTTTLEDRYVPRREYEQRVGEVEKDISAQANFRRQVAAGVIVGLALLVANIFVIILRVPGGPS